ncbi:GNAT family N-acetyltransferase [Methylopila turkensis]|uniref:GNAT family N-acetyltransferase n=1 Tax=Methylopila turkensis TaxID=1437816 RepID=A0A9W6N6P5_9HYPH|nr:GNAT family N-acetyltransferase [Methylopila turkensis]GLK79527.1 GNAT family N-acetyltransferase [Methylopila turkensis]
MIPRAPAAYAFRAVTPDDLPQIAGWLREPHVARWWGDPDQQLALIREDLSEPRMALSIVSIDGRPSGYVQAYGPFDFGTLAGQPAGSKGIDQFIGAPDLVGKGHGPALTEVFVATLFAAGAPRVVTDPHPDNAVAIRAYEKAGFRRERLIHTEDGPAVLMARDRA